MKKRLFTTLALVSTFAFAEIIITGSEVKCTSNCTTTITPGGTTMCSGSSCVSISPGGIITVGGGGTIPTGSQHK